MKHQFNRQLLCLAVMLTLWPLFGTAQGNLDSGLVAYYPFDGSAVDSTGNGNDGILFGPVLTTDELGNANGAYQFDGINDWINLGDGDDFRFQAGKSFSLVAHVFVEKPTNYGNIFRYDDLDGSDGDRVNPRDVVSLRIDDQDSGFVVLFGHGRGPSNSGLLTIVISSLHSYDQWYWIYGVYDSDLDSIFLYIDHCLEGAAVDQSPPDWVTTGQYLMCGKYSESEYFKGKIDQLSVYDRVIPPRFPGGKCDSVSTGVLTLGDKDVQLSPNPAQGHFSLSSPHATITSIALYDLTGRRLPAEISHDRHEAYVRSSYRGLALVKVQTSRGVWVEKVILY